MKQITKIQKAKFKVSTPGVTGSELLGILFKKKGDRNLD